MRKDAESRADRKINRLERQMKMAADEELESLRRQITRLEENSRETANAHKSEIDDLESLREKELERVRSQLNHKIELLQNKVQNKVESGLETMAHITGKYDTLAIESENLHAANDANKIKIIELEATLVSSEETIETVTQQKRMLEQRVESLDATIASLKEENMTMGIKVDSLEIHKIELGDEQDKTLNDARKTPVDMAAEHQRSLLELEAAHEQATSEAETRFKQEVDMLKENHAAELFATKRDQSTAMSTLRVELEASHAAAIEALKADSAREIDALHQAHADASELVASRHREKTEASIAETEEKALAAGKEMINLQDQLKLAKSRASAKIWQTTVSFKKREHEFQEKIVALEREKAAILKDIAKLQTAHEAGQKLTNDELATLNKELTIKSESFSADLKRIRMERDVLQERLRDQTARNARLEESMNGEAKAASIRYDERESEMRSLEERMEAEKEALRSRLEMQNEELKQSLKQANVALMESGRDR